MSGKETVVYLWGQPRVGSAGHMGLGVIWDVAHREERGDLVVTMTACVATGLQEIESLYWLLVSGGTVCDCSSQFPSGR